MIKNFKLNSIEAIMRRLIAYRDGYNGNSAIEKRDRNRAVLEYWASIPDSHRLLREKYRAVAGQPKECQ